MEKIEDLVYRMNSYIEGQRNEIIDFLKEFIGIKSTTYDEKDAAKFLARKMDDFGFDEVRVDKVGNVIGRVGKGKTVILYDAHIDTVEPGAAKDWGFDPLSAQVMDGYICGRGAVDDKGCLAGITYAGKAIKALGLYDDFTLFVSGSISEEDVEGSCVDAMLKENPDIKPDYVLVAEASENRIIRGHKGRALIKILVPGKSAHASAAYRGENALIKALPIIDAVDKFNDFTEDPFLGKGTIEVTKVDCKTPSLNTIPYEAVVFCDRRISCGETVEDLLKEIRPFMENIKGVHAEIDREKVTTYTGYEIYCTDYFPSWVIPEEHKIVKSGIDAYKAVFGREPVVGKWDFCTNATFLCGKNGIPSIGFGPGDGSLCHSTNERLSISELADAVKFYSIFPFVICRK